MNVYYLLSDSAFQKAADSNQNYWFRYIEEILDNLGVEAKALIEGELKETELKGTDFLFLGPDRPDAADIAIIEKASNNGCTVVGFATEGLDNVFGISTGELIPQPESPFSLAGYFDVKASMIDEYLPVPEQGFTLPIFAPVRRVTANGCEVIADIHVQKQTVLGLSKAVKAEAYYFSFNLMQSIWASRQGQPETEPVAAPGRRITDMRVTPYNYDTSIAYNDYYLYLLQYILAKKGLPMLHRLPPLRDGSVPDFVLFYQGDEDAEPGVGNASEVMHQRGLPYHINIMPDPGTGQFVMSREEYKKIKEKGHTIGVHQYFYSDWAKFSKEGFQYHTDLFEKTYGEKPYSGLTHACYVSGWAELARYQAETGLWAQNIWSAELTPSDNINAFNLCGMAFGTAYPFFFYDDIEHKNQRIPLIGLPNSYYEPRVGEGYEKGKEMIRAYLDGSAFFGRTSVMFIHPHYLLPPYNTALTYAALDEADQYCNEKGYIPCRYTADQLTAWWHARSVSRVSDIRKEGGRIAFSVIAKNKSGVVVKLPAHGKTRVQVKVDNRTSKGMIKRVEGRDWIMIPVGAGIHAVEVVQED